MWRGLAAGANAYAATFDGLLAGQRSLMYFPDPTRPRPAEADVPDMAEVALTTEDGLELLAWHRAPAEPGGPTLLYFHGNAGHIGMRGFKVRPYLDAGLGVLLTTWRGYSGNPGRPSEEGLYADARAALAHLERCGVVPDSLVLYGESLGTGVAVQIATELRAAALVLEAPFSSIADVAQARLPLVPVKPFILDRFESRTKIRRIETPLLVVHGALDETVPARFGRKLFRAARQPKEAVFLPEAAHNDLYDHGMARIVLDFLETHLGPARR